VELLTGIYTILFPFIFSGIFESSFAGSNHFIFHIFLTAAICLPPTILMGANVPIMTKVLPKSENKVGSIHSSIYSINTLGAVVGIFSASFWTLPEFGFKYSLFIFGGLNALVSFVYILNKLPSRFIYKRN